MVLICKRNRSRSDNESLMGTFLRGRITRGATEATGSHSCDYGSSQHTLSGAVILAVFGQSLPCPHCYPPHHPLNRSVASLVYPKDGQGHSTSSVRINKSLNPTEGNQNNLTPNRKESKKATRTKSSLIPDEVVDGFSHSPYIPIDPLIHIIIVSCCCCFC